MESVLRTGCSGRFLNSTRIMSSIDAMFERKGSGSHYWLNIPQTLSQKTLETVYGKELLWGTLLWTLVLIFYAAAVTGLRLDLHEWWQRCGMGFLDRGSNYFMVHWVYNKLRRRQQLWPMQLLTNKMFIYLDFLLREAVGAAMERKRNTDYFKCLGAEKLK